MPVECLEDRTLLTAPELTDLNITRSIDEGGQAELFGTITDPDAGDSFTLVVNWGDGSGDLSYTLAAGTTSLTGITHTYVDDGTFDVRVISLTDSGGESAAWDSEADSVSPETTLISRHDDGTPSDNPSSNSSVSANGKFVVYQSYATTLVDGDSNGHTDIFLYDVEIGTTNLVSRQPDGTAADGGSFEPSISADGKFVTFRSDATNLVDSDTNSSTDIFLYDVENETTILISQHDNGTAGDGNSSNPSISADGKFVTYWSAATSLVDGDTNGRADIFLYDVENETTILISRHDNGTTANLSSFHPSISADGMFVTYESDATTLVDGHTNLMRDIFLYDVENETTRLISQHDNGTASDRDSYTPTISADGKLVIYRSSATNLVDGDTNGRVDIFLYDVVNETTTLISQHDDGTAANGNSSHPSISANGTFATYDSDATTLVDGDVNGRQNIFLYDIANETTRLISRHDDGTAANGDSFAPSISADGAIIAYQSGASNLVDDDINSISRDLFLYNAETPLAVTVSGVNGTSPDHVGFFNGRNWYLDANGNGVWDGNGIDQSHQFGSFSQPDSPIVGDWDGDGVDNIGIHRGYFWYLDYNGNGIFDGVNGGDRVYQFGIDGDIAVIGDWDGDGADEIGVHRQFRFWLDRNGDGQWSGKGPGQDMVYAFGIVGDTPLAGDWNGDGSHEIGVHRGNRFFLDASGNGAWDGRAGGDKQYHYGLTTDVAVIGDWDDDGVDDIGVKRRYVPVNSQGSGYARYYLDANGNGIWDGFADDRYLQFSSYDHATVIGRWV